MAMLAHRRVSAPSPPIRPQGRRPRLRPCVAKVQVPHLLAQRFVDCAASTVDNENHQQMLE